MNQMLGRMLGVENVQAVDGLHLSLAAPWLQTAWGMPLLIGLLLLFVAVTALFYALLQHRAGWSRLGLAAFRSALLCLLLFVLAEPVLVFRSTSKPRPYLWLLFDGTDSMAIQDELTDSERRALEDGLGLRQPRDARSAASPSASTVATTANPTAAGSGNAAGGSTASAANPAALPDKPSRQDYVQAMLAVRDDNVLRSLEERFRLKAFLFDDGVRELPDPAAWADTPELLREQLSTKGQYTALGTAFEELARRQATSSLAGLVVVSDFDQNSGPAAPSSARRLGAPVHTLGIGPAAARDLRLKLEAPLWMTKSERSELTVFVEKEGIEDIAAEVRLTARPLDGDASLGGSEQRTIEIGRQRVPLRGASTAVAFPYTPEVTGRYLFTAETDPVEGEVVHQNNRAEREVSLRDDFLRLLYVEYEPTWEWRFIKEVFHRDKLVGMRGFRTFLRSADPKVRQENELFVPTLTPPRSDFFASDVIFLGDMPAASLSTRFCELTKEFVGKFGGGLVIIAGPRFGPGQLAGTPLADMLPVVVESETRIRDSRPFQPQLTSEAQLYNFMQFGATPQEQEKVWSNLKDLQWYQPVARADDRATVLAVHPVDRCANNQPQPLIAVRQYGNGIVVYVGFNEMWRLRRKYGERYYRQFWGQMIHQLASRRALGTQKRFVVRTDRQQYKVDDEAVLTIEAYDADYQPLRDDQLPDGRLTAEIVIPGVGPDGARREERIAVARKRDALLEAQLPLTAPGEYLVRVRDPVTNQYVESRFQAADVSAERRSAVRNVALQKEISLATGGRAYELFDARKLAAEIEAPEQTETSVQVITIWHTAPGAVLFGLVLCLMCGEWFWRKMATLP